MPAADSVQWPSHATTRSCVLVGQFRLGQVAKAGSASPYWLTSRASAMLCKRPATTDAPTARHGGTFVRTADHEERLPAHVAPSGSNAVASISIRIGTAPKSTPGIVVRAGNGSLTKYVR